MHEYYLLTIDGSRFQFLTDKSTDDIRSLIGNKEIQLINNFGGEANCIIDFSKVSAVYTLN